MGWHRIFVLSLSLSLAACARDLDTEDPGVFPKHNQAAVEAQFDPSNQIPVLRLIPSPTALAERGADDHSINLEAVEPAPCQLPSAAQCLQWVDGWPTTLYPTLYFSGEIDLATVAEGIIWMDLDRGTAVAFTPEMSPRPAPPEACKSGDNGSEGLTYTDAEVPPGVQLVLTPKAPLSPDTSYAIWVRSGADGGLRDALGRVIDSSALMSLLNRTEPAVEADGTLKSAVLRSQVQTIVLEDAGLGHLDWSELSAAQRSAAEAAVLEKGAQLYPVSAMMRGLVDAAIERSLAEARAEIVFANRWTTGPAAQTAAVFDPENSLIPIPNDQLLLLRDAAGAPTHVNLPTEGLEGSSLRMVQGLNELDGFSTLAPITVPISRSLDMDSVDGRVLMFELSGGAIGEQVPLHIEQSRADSETQVSLRLQPAMGRWEDPEAPGEYTTLPYPLKPGTRYVIALKEGLRDLHGAPVVAASAFSILRSKEPLTEVVKSHPEVKQMMQCAVYQSSGSMPDDAALSAYLEGSIEAKNAEGQPRSLDRESWQPVFEALEAAPTPVARESLVMAFSYTTQQLHKELRAGEALLASLSQRADWVTRVTRYEQAGILPSARGVSNVARFDEDVCTRACESFSDPTKDCDSIDWLKGWSIECAALRGAFFSELRYADLYSMRAYGLTEGNPFSAGAISAATLQAPREEQRAVWVILPDSNSAHRQPAAGWPVVIFQHALTADAKTSFMLANSLAKEGFATIAMDLPFHGSRVSDVVNNTTGEACVDVDPAAVRCAEAANEGEDYARCSGGCDGLADTSGSGFLSPNAFGVRGAIQQSAIDQLNLLRAIQAGRFEGIDPGEVSYIGMSLGGITGSGLLSYLGEGSQLRRAVLNATGGGLIDALLGAGPQLAEPLFSALKEAGLCSPIDADNISAGCAQTEAFLQFSDFSQWGLDSADPLALSRSSSYPAERLLFQQATPDPIFNNRSTASLAQAHGIGADSERLQRWPFSVEGGCHGFLLDISCSANGQCGKQGVCTSLSAQGQAARFLKTGEIGVPTAAPGIGFNCNNPCD